MAQTQKYIFNVDVSNTGDPGVDLETDGWQNQQVLESKSLNAYIAQGSNWAGDFKSLTICSDTTLDLPAATNCRVFDLITLTNVAGCAVNIDLTAIGTSLLSIGQILHIWNNTNVNSQYLVNGANPQPIYPGEKIKLLIYSSSTVVNLNDLESSVPPGTISLRFNNAPQRGWLLIDGASATSATTIGKTGSGAFYASDTYGALYATFWALSEPDHQLFIVQGGKGASAAADFTAGKGIIIDNLFNAVPAICAGAGQMWGKELIQLGIEHMPQHNHNVTDPGHTHVIIDPGHNHTPLEDYGAAVVQAGPYNGPPSGSGYQWDGVQLNPNTTGITAAEAFTGINTTDTGGGDYFDARPPTIAPYTFLKL
jgi:hypothetical protein